ncbi:septum formation family protein, partial [Rathayibacter sp. AY1D9]|uniref:septum formation family protein n=2 Tax=unclassified Rathayibacter TaxID=2609250 RepID=UPI001CA58F5F
VPPVEESRAERTSGPAESATDEAHASAEERSVASESASSADAAGPSSSDSDSDSDAAPPRAPAAPVGLWPGEPVLSATPAAEEAGGDLPKPADDSARVEVQDADADRGTVVEPERSSDRDGVSAEGRSSRGGDTGVPDAGARAVGAPETDAREASARETGAGGTTARETSASDADVSDEDDSDEDAFDAFFAPLRDDNADGSGSDASTDAGRTEVHRRGADSVRPVLPHTDPPADLPTAPAGLRSAHRPDDEPDAGSSADVDPAGRSGVPYPADGRPVGATPPTPREPTPPAVYEWPDPRGDWDQPPVWEQVVAPQDEPDDDGGDEELWRETAGAYSWNLEPAAEPADRAEPAPFRTAPAAAHVNAAPPRKRRSARSRPESRERDSAPAGAPAWRTLSRRRLLIGLIAAGAVILLAGLFAIGIAVGSAGGRAEPQAVPVVSETPTAEPTPSPTPTATLPTVGPLPVGTWAWSALLGGECVEPFDSVWAEEFTVVDCAGAHSAQLVATAELTDAVFPGQDALAVTVSSLCQAQGVVDVAAAETYGDVQVAGAFPVTQEQWDAGERSYYCFVDRAGGGELTGSLAGTPAA